MSVCQQLVFVLAACLLLPANSRAGDARDLPSNESHSAIQATVVRSIDFQRDVRPILSENCFQCHGPDENTREADLRLDSFQAASTDLGGYAAVVPGNPTDSELVRRIQSGDEYEQMPPPDSGKKLSAEEINLLFRWIDSGAEYQDHWSFVSPRRPLLPDVQDASWPENEIDHFVLHRMQSDGLKALCNRQPLCASEKSLSRFDWHPLRQSKRLILSSTIHIQTLTNT